MDQESLQDATDDRLSNLQQSSDFPGAFPRSSSSSPSPPSLAPLPPFPLLQLPQEVILHIIYLLDERLISPTFPAGPSTDLLNLSQVNNWFNACCRPLIWRSVKYKPEHKRRPIEWRRKRGLRALREIVKAAEESQRPFKVLQFSVDDPANDEVIEAAEGQQEEDAAVDVMEIWAKSSLQVRFLFPSFPVVLVLTLSHHRSSSSSPPR
jgi:hypothetical protein